MKSFAFKILKIITKPFIGKGLGRIPYVSKLYRNIARIMIPECEKEIEIHGFKLLAHIDKGRDIDGIAQQLLFEGDYEPLMTSVFKKIVKPNDVVIDIGANIGYYSMLAASLVGVNGVVWSFEPEPTNYEYLKKNVELNNYLNIFSQQKAVTSKTGYADLYVSKVESGEHSLLSVRDHVKDSIRVQTLALDDLFTTNTKVNVIKTDTEGNDCNIIYGARNLIKANDVKLFLEWWDDGIIESGWTPIEFWELLKSVGFKYFYMIDEFKNKIYTATIFNISAYYKKHKFAVNILCSKGDICL